MGPLLITIVIFLILSIYLIVAFIADFWYVVVNLVLLWFVLLRSYFEVRHKRILYPYFVSLVITAVLFVLFGNFLKMKYVLWQVEFIVIVFIIAELINLGIYYFKEYEIEKKFNKWSNNRKKK